MRDPSKLFRAWARKCTSKNVRKKIAPQAQNSRMLTLTRKYYWMFAKAKLKVEPKCFVKAKRMRVGNTGAEYG
jgi:hypothetical protein